MKELSELPVNAVCVITSLEGDQRFISRITSIGLTPGCRVSVIKNDGNKRTDVLVFMDKRSYKWYTVMVCHFLLQLSGSLCIYGVQITFGL